MGKLIKFYIENSFFGKTKMEYLVFWVTWDGIKPIDKNKNNKNMKPPISRKEVRKFIGLVNYYSNMWARCSHILATLTNITYSKVKFKWTKTEQGAFE